MTVRPTDLRRSAASRSDQLRPFACFVTGGSPPVRIWPGAADGGDVRSKGRRPAIDGRVKSLQKWWASMMVVVRNWSSFNGAVTKAGVYD